MKIFLEQELCEAIFTYVKKEKSIKFKDEFVDDLLEFLVHQILDNEGYLCKCHYKTKPEDDFLSNIILHKYPVIQIDSANRKIPFALIHCNDCGSSKNLHVESLVMSMSDFFYEMEVGHTHKEVTKILYDDTPTNLKNNVKKVEKEKIRGLIFDILSKKKNNLLSIPLNTKPISKQNGNADIINLFGD